MEDLFDREEELQELHNSDVPMQIILAPRRFGKTSLLKVFVNETSYPYIYTDCRAFQISGFSVASFYRHITKELNRFLKSDNNFLKWLRRIRGINAFGVDIKFEEKEKQPSLLEIFERLNEWVSKRGEKLLLIFDEAQYLRFFKRHGGINFVSFFAFIYDNFKNMQIILTGSEVGLLKDFLGSEDSSSPLYGRYIKELALSRFSQEDSIKFLRIGFEQIKMFPKVNILERVVEVLDGIVGWLVFFGKRCIDKKEINEEILKEVLDKARIIVTEELNNLSKHSKRYLYVLQVISLGIETWHGIKEAVEFKEKADITDTAFTRILNKLVDMCYVTVEIDERGKRYKIVDPVIKEILRSNL